jgi:heme exporter protein A
VKIGRQFQTTQCFKMGRRPNLSTLAMTPITPLRLSATTLAGVRGGRVIFSGVSFDVAPGELLAITGRNGAGKSTLLRLVAGLARPTEGEIRIEPAPEGAAIHYLGHLDALKGGLSVRQNLDHWRRVWGGAESEAALAAVGLTGLADLPAGVLSAGERRRAAIARLLIRPRPIWLLDEPAAGLDAAAEADLGRIIAAHLAGGGMAVAAMHRALPVAATQTLRLGP